MKSNASLTRRDWLKSLAAGALAAPWIPASLGAAEPQLKPKRVAAVFTEFRKLSHADVLLGKILEGWKQDGGPGPAIELVSMYADQFPETDLARRRSREHNVPIFGTIAEAITLGGNEIAVDGVLSIGEHGRYPYNEKGQHLYPRRRFHQEITDTFAKHGRVVPLFNDKHLGPPWDDARWMYDRVLELEVPYMAGSSIPVSYRTPDLNVEVGAEIEAAVGIGYSELDAYGFHALEAFQSLVEKRRGGEVGVEWVQCLQGPDMWAPLEDGRVSRELFEAALRVTPGTNGQPVPAETLKALSGDHVALFLFGYRDGFLGAIYVLTGLAGGISAALKLKGQAEPAATYFEERPDPYYPHFAFLLKGIERFLHTGKAPYPVERTVLTSGILDRLLTSRADAHKKLDTPELAIPYQPVNYPHAPLPDLSTSPVAV